MLLSWLGGKGKGRRTNRRGRRPAPELMEDRVVPTAASHQAAVAQLYQDLLHRLPDAGGLVFWAGQLDAGAGTQAVATALTHSTEFHRGEVDGVYQRLLNRAADDGGLTFFASALDKGQTVPQVEVAVTSSPEYAQSHPGVSGFLDALFNGADHLRTLVSGAYQQVLHRAGDVAGLDYWAGQMAEGESLDDVTAALAASVERAALPAATATILGTFRDASSLPLGAVGGLETALAGTVHAALGASAGSGVGPQAVTLKNGAPVVFQAFGPERLVDTRNPTVGQYGGPAFAAGSTRTINVSPYNLADPSIPSPVVPGEQAPTSNLPVGIKAVSLILFIVGAPQQEYLTAYATGTNPAPIGTATVFADHAGETIAASAIVPVNAAGNIDIYSSGGGTLVVDVNGYYLDALDGTDNLPISGNVPGGAGNTGVVVGTNGDTTASANGVTGVIASTGPGASSAGVRGINNGTGAAGIGVYGSQAGSGVGGVGVQGASSGAASAGGSFFGETGVRGITSDTGAVSGVLGQVTSSSAAADSAGVHGTNASTTAMADGVLGEITSTTPGAFSAGVRGVNNGTGTTGIGVYGFQAGGGIGVYGFTNLGGTGVQGASNVGIGVQGISTSAVGVQGLSSGNTGTGVLGKGMGDGIGTAGLSNAAVLTFLADGVGVEGAASLAGGVGVLGLVSGSGGFGVFAGGNFAATGTKNFVDPSPSDPSKQIAFVALEGNEVGTYFGGRGHITAGTATLDVPQSFRDVTDPDGLRVQVTPVGALATLAVRSMDLNHIVVLGSQDVDFFYTVNGIRAGYQGYNPIQPNFIYVPHSASDTLPNWLTDVQRAKVIADGIYHADGTVNLTTAHKLGWDVLWAANGTARTSSAAAAAAR